MPLIAMRRIVVAAICLGPLAAFAAGPAASSSSVATRSSRPTRGAATRVASTSGRKVAAPPVNRNGPVELFSVNGKETLFLRLRDDKGRPLRGVQKRFDHFLRCHHTNVTHAMNPRLVRVLYQVGKHYPGRRVEVVSGYRHPSVAKNPRSPHMQGLACDFRIAGVRNQDLRDYLRRGYEKVGVGYYPNSSFVHLDVRKDRSAFWIDYSGPGERATYSENPVADLKSGRADSYKPLTIDKEWANDADQDGDTGRQPSSGASSPLEEAAEQSSSGRGGRRAVAAPEEPLPVDPAAAAAAAAAAGSAAAASQHRAAATTPPAPPDDPPGGSVARE
jgi:uncharacterized protein YcbK (DUF882 family)